MDHVNLYDFDGVIVNAFEEALFNLPETEHDFQFIRRVSHRFDLDLSQESRKSARYICMQAIMDRNNIRMEPGLMFDHISKPFHIITARCDRFAVKRMHKFLMERGLEPIKIMQMDHLAKGLMIESLLERHQETRFTFWDDNLRHVTSARLLRHPRLEVFHVDNNLKDFYTKAESFYLNFILELSQ